VKLLENAIETSELTRRFNGLVAVDRLSISVERGEVFGLLGPNGAGKTTTISMLCTILKPTSGRASVNGFDIVKQDTQVRKSIGIVFQDPSIDDRLTGRENLYMHANLYGVPPGDQKSRIDTVLKLVELEDRADDLLRTYSGGMRRRLEIARGLIHYPKVLFLDEPTIGLDPQTREHIWSYIEELRKAHDITMVLTTHYMEEPDRLSSALAGMPGILKANAVDERLEVTVRGGKALLPRIVETAAKSGMFVESVSLREPNLEDVFLHYTGRAIRPEGSDELHGMAAIRRRRIK
jgi:ABC-2 type transport system ATP-binding protein